MGIAHLFMLSSETIQNVDDTVSSVISSTTKEEVDPGVIRKFFDELPDKVLSFAIKVVLAIIVIIVCVQIIRFLTRIIRKSLEHSSAEESSIHFICSFIKVSLYVVLGFGVAAAFGMSTASIVALLGSAGVAIGLAVQGSLSNFAGGIMILLQKPFKLGDFIREDGSGHEGYVKEISLFCTKLQTVDNKIVVLPNGTLANSALTNSSTNESRRVDICVGVAYDTDIKLAKSILENAVSKNRYALQDDEIQVCIKDFGDSAIELIIMFYTKKNTYLNAKYAMNDLIKEGFDKAGIEIPYPQMDVHLKANKPIEN